MTRLRRPLAGLVLLFTAAIAVDRAGLSRGSDAIASHVYALAALAVTAPLVFAGLRRARPWLVPAVAVAIHLLFGGAIARLRSVDGDVYVVVTEVAFLALASWLGQRVGTILGELDETLGAVAFGESPAIDIESPKAAAEIHAELARSRRHGRSMTLTVLVAEERSLARAIDQASGDMDRAVRNRFVLGRLARAVGDQLRRSDLLFEHRASGQLFILSPETDQAGAELLVRRVVDAAARVGVPAHAGTAAFPDDAIAFEGLVEHAERVLAASHTHQPLLRAVNEMASG
ncbi:MAG: hypothetical protein WEE36_05465 [Acidimicrobiia bacterium]